MMTGEITTQRKIIELAHSTIAAAESKIATLQASCRHRWHYQFCALDHAADCDMLHTWTCLMKCDHCGLESKKHGFYAFCKVHLSEMTHKEILKHLSPQRGQRDRHEYKIQYQCKKKGYAQNSVYKLIGGRD